MDKLKIVLDLVRKGAITDEQAKELLETEKETVFQYYPYHGGNWTYPYRWNPYPYITCSYGTTSATSATSHFHGSNITVNC